MDSVCTLLPHQSRSTINGPNLDVHGTTLIPDANSLDKPRRRGRRRRGGGAMMERASERAIGEYLVGERIGRGSFAVVWRARHRRTGAAVAVKEVDRKQLAGKALDGLRKEIDILSRVSHPNIVRLLHHFQTEDKIYLVLEYCTGGDLSAYIQRHGRVSEAVARHFMRQLASGLQVLRENNLIHRDLKPQNLLLSTCDENPVLKIGDFGFARYLNTQGLAETLCGSPLYMAPEIIQNKKYDAKADLWSVGAILFHLVTGKPPFDGDSQLQLFQNVLTSNELHFPKDVLVDLHPDCIDLCKSLLRRNPVERLTFEDFFNHKFMTSSRSGGSSLESLQNPVDDNLQKIDGNNPSCSAEFPSMKSDSLVRELFHITSKGFNSFEAIEKEYVLVHAHFASMETSFSVGASLQDNSPTNHPNYTIKKIGIDTLGLLKTEELATSFACDEKSLGSHINAPCLNSRASAVSKDLWSSSSSHPSTRLQFLYQDAYVLTELAEEKLNVGLSLESFAVELVALAVWKEALRVCSSWMASSTDSNAINSSAANECHQKDGPYVNLEQVDFRRPLSVFSWVEKGFVLSYDRAEKIFKSLHIDGDMEMPDAVEIIFQAALSAGKSGAVDELMGNKSRAVTSYSKATILLTFILVEGMSLPLNPPFSLSLDDRQRIQRYIVCLRAHLNQLQMAEFSITRT